MTNVLVQIQSITVPAIVVGNRAFLIDSKGRQICRSRLLTSFEGIADESVVVSWRWRLAVQRMKHRAQSHCGEQDRDPWAAKVKSLETSLRLRRTFATSRPRRRQRFEHYLTHEWPDAVHRMLEQGRNRSRRHSRDGWVRWAHTVSNNHNKRKGGRYASAIYSHSQDDLRSA